MTIRSPSGARVWLAAGHNEAFRRGLAASLQRRADLFNSGGGFRITPTQQIDFQAAIGPNHDAPAYAFGI